MTKDELSKLQIYIISVLVSSAILATTDLLFSNAFAVDNNWYVGEGVTKDMYVKYRMSHFDTNNGREFIMTIYFKEQDDQGNWIAPVFVEDQGKVFNGTFLLSPLDLTALGTSQIPPEMAKYRSAYANSLQWLAAFVPKPGQSLNAGSWGKIASIGGSEIKPSGNQELNIPAFPDPVDTVRVEYYKGIASNTYLLNEFPYPVMAKTYVDVTTGSAPIQFQYILVETGKGQPAIPQASIVEVTPPLKQRTDRGDYYVSLDWNPPTITTGNETTFTVEIADKDQFPVTQASYDFMIMGSNNTILLDLKNQLAREGTKDHSITFDQPGIVTVKIQVNSVKGVTTGIFTELVEFVVPVK
ncbi:MAG TPA: hypothetical protein VK882_01040 [Nitrososphaeraceae archaeon]|nr:hypothetical protein [Nitrososphaeraceae archaeon]